MINYLIKLITTFFYIGYIPYVSGTIGSLAGIAVYYFIYNSFFVYLSVLIFFLILGFALSGKAERIFGKKDPRFVVIDEVCGMLICLWGLEFELRTIAVSFILFRIFDVLKPFPIKRFQDIKGSFGIMFDDLVASIYTIICAQIVFKFIS